MGVTTKIRNAKRLLRQQAYTVLAPSHATDMANWTHNIMDGYDVKRATEKLQAFFDQKDDGESEW